MPLFTFAIDINIVWSPNATNKAFKDFVFYWVSLVTHEYDNHKTTHIYMMVRGLFFEYDHSEK